MRQQGVVPSSVISSHSMHLGVLATAWHAISTGTMFTVYYKPRYVLPHAYCVLWLLSCLFIFLQLWATRLGMSDDKDYSLYMLHIPFKCSKFELVVCLFCCLLIIKDLNNPFPLPSNCLQYALMVNCISLMKLNCLQNESCSVHCPIWSVQGSCEEQLFHRHEI